MQLHDILSAQYIEPEPSTAMQLVIDATIEGQRDEVPFVYRTGDEFGLSADVSAWLAEHPEFVPTPYAEPEPADPLTVDLPRREFRRALLHNGMDTATVLSVINAISDPTDREEMTIWWEDTVLFQRTHPVLVDMVAAAGLTTEQGDAIWAYGVDLLDGE